MSNELKLAQLERDIKAHKANKEMAESLDRLRSNRDFKKVIEIGFLKDEAVRLVHAKGNPDLQTPAAQASILRDIDAIATMGQYFITIDQRGRIATKELDDAYETREELQKEGI